MSKANPSEQAFQKFLNDPLLIDARMQIPDRLLGLVDSALRAAFMEGASYAADRCAKAGHPAVRD